MQTFSHIIEQKKTLNFGKKYWLLKNINMFILKHSKLGNYQTKCEKSMAFHKNKVLATLIKFC